MKKYFALVARDEKNKGKIIDRYSKNVVTFTVDALNEFQAEQKLREVYGFTHVFEISTKKFYQEDAGISLIGSSFSTFGKGGSRHTRSTKGTTNVGA